MSTYSGQKTACQILLLFHLHAQSCPADANSSTTQADVSQIVPCLNAAVIPESSHVFRAKVICLFRLPISPSPEASHGEQSADSVERLVRCIRTLPEHFHVTGGPQHRRTHVFARLQLRLLAYILEFRPCHSVTCWQSILWNSKVSNLRPGTTSLFLFRLTSLISRYA